MDKLIVRGTEINVQWDLKRDDFLSLTDIAKIKDNDNPRYIIQNWLRNRNTIEFLGVFLIKFFNQESVLGMGLRSPHEGKSLPAPSVLGESPAVLKTAGLSKRIRKEVIFEDISLSVPKGGVTAITGQNGAGKTTLAQILCGLARQTRGHILIDGEKARAAVRRREIYYCGNDTSTQFFTASVAEELLP